MVAIESKIITVDILSYQTAVYINKHKLLQNKIQIDSYTSFENLMNIRDASEIIFIEKLLI